MRALFLALLLTATSAFAADPAYVFKRGERPSTTSRGLPIRSVVRIAKRWTGDFLWTRRDGREYLIRDAVTLAEAKKAFAELDAMGREVDAFHRRMRPVEEREEALEEKIDSIGDRLGDEGNDLRDADRRALEARLRELEQEMRTVERELHALEEEERRVDRRHEAIEAAAEAELEVILVRAIRRGVAERVD